MSGSANEVAAAAVWKRYCDLMDGAFPEAEEKAILTEFKGMVAEVGQKAFLGILHLHSKHHSFVMRQMAADIAILQRQVSQQKAMIYRGVHVSGELYDVGDMVTYAGGIWHCNEITEARPGDGNPAWTLAVKKGRDAKGVTRATA